MKPSIFRREGRRGWTLKYTDRAGRERMRTFRTAGAAAEEAKRLACMPAGEAGATFGDFARRWLQHVAGGIRRGTLTNYAYNVRKLIAYFGQDRLAEITTPQVKDFLSLEMRPVAEGGNGLARKTAANIRGVFFSIMEEARIEKHIAENPVEDLGKSKAFRLTPTKAERAAKVKAFTAEQVPVFFDAVRQSRPKRLLLYRTLLQGGLRLGEALGLQWPDIDHEAGLIRVRRAWTRSEAALTKSGMERDVDMASGLSGELRAWEVACKAAALRAGRTLPLWVFPSSRGTPIDHNHPERDFKIALKAAGLPNHYTPHSLRHTFACLHLVRGESIYYVQRQLGHASIQMTVDLYGSWLPAGNRGCAERLEAQVTKQVTADPLKAVQ